MPDIAYQLYSSRNWEAADTFEMLAHAGYTAVEGVGPFYEDIAATRALLDRYGMTMPTGHFALDLIEAHPQQVIDIATQLGMSAVIVPFVAPQDRPDTATGWATFGVRLARAAAPIIAAGLPVAWHNHDFEFAPVDGELPMDIIATTAPDIMFELDLAWVQVSGHDPIMWLQKLARRIAAVHIKDIAPKGQNVDEDGWADVGHGVMDWAAITPALRAAGVTRYVVEHDNPNDHKRFATRSFASVRAF